MTTVLAADPGACTGWALADDGHLLASGIVREPGPSKARPTMAHRQAEYARRVWAVTSDAALGLWRGSRGDMPDRHVLVVEWPTGGGARRRVSAIQRGAWRCGVWLGDGAVSGYIEVSPSGWGAAAGLPVREDFEAAYIERARAILGREPVTPDEAAAVCLAVHASLRLSLGLPVGRTEEEAAAAVKAQGRASRARAKARKAP